MRRGMSLKVRYMGWEAEGRSKGNDQKHSRRIGYYEQMIFDRKEISLKQRLFILERFIGGEVVSSEPAIPSTVEARYF